MDIASLAPRLEHITKSIERTDIMCKSLLANVKTCKNLHGILDKGHNKTKHLIHTIQMVYRTPTDKRRGLINGVGSIAKTLFGTMDADDEKTINEQLTLLENNNAVTKHAVENQLKVINATIAHVETLEQTIQENENALTTLLEKIQNQNLIHNRRYDLDEHFTVLNALTNDLLQDASDIIEYLAYIKEGILHPKIANIDQIMEALREASLTWPQGLYLPTGMRNHDWLKIEKLINISAYCDIKNMYTILRFPLASLPIYRLMRIIALPVHNHLNIFSSVKTTTEYLAIDAEKQTYLTISESDLQGCNKINTEHICEATHAINKINTNAICEVQMYIHNRNLHCNINHIISERAIWIKTHDSWLYSTAKPEEISIKCLDHPEGKETINNTGKIIINENCKIVTTELIIKPHKTLSSKILDTYMPRINITMIQEISLDNHTDSIHLRKISDNPHDFGHLKMSIEKIKQELESDQEPFFRKKQFIYPMTTSGVTALIIIAIMIYIIYTKQTSKPPRPNKAGCHLRTKL
ncbi:uncharacterized protein LOC118647693 [Monomorium pharaonis]|uniref:uncharacterized protein LOC118647693 n=1 Tax=Monomorium pharaonis TaxID=307658 RepID=UPI001746E87B|nr:uncharacterized protein LOC118647693 [Monomorium pharaonis]